MSTRCRFTHRSSNHSFSFLEFPLPIFFFVFLLCRCCSSALTLISISPWSISMDADGSSKKLRKPYTITKSRDRWSDEEHERFLDALLLFGREWKKIEDFVGTKTVIQVQKNGIMAHVPPARPKRNATHPYPKKPADDDPTPLQLQASMVYSSASTGFIISPSSWDDPSLLRDYTSNDAMSSSNYYNALCGVEGDNRPLGLSNIYHPNICWTGNSSASQFTSGTPKEGNQQSFHPAIPEFAKVYHFIGTLIDPDVTCTLGMYLQKLKEMDPITAKTVLILVKNLVMNLSSSEFDPLMKWMSTYDPETKMIGSAAEVSALVNVMYPPYQPPPPPHDFHFLPLPPP
ncbi:Transcription factor ASG4 [Platanthera guangdongensis]|uniref:Transcription factor ASG4 n=1 Tax=Platanthera guangdongensis TaxID=2320717 RepID=A0ABR2LWH5_9ASPA